MNSKGGREVELRKVPSDMPTVKQERCETFSLNLVIGTCRLQPEGIRGEESVAPKGATNFTGTFFSKKFIFWIACKFFKNIRSIDFPTVVNKRNGDLSPVDLPMRSKVRRSTDK
jgi:hypothetical protein